MALIQREGKLVRDLWPEGLPRISSEIQRNDDDARRIVVPEDYDGVVTWAYVQELQKSTLGRRYALLLKSPTAGKYQQVGLRLQGYIFNAKLATLGGWNGTLQGAPRAVQTLTIGDNDKTSPFNAQVASLDNIKDYIFRSYGTGTRRPAEKDLHPTRIHMRRRVFTKRTEGDATPTALARGDDPQNNARQIDASWYVKDKVKIYYQDEAGKLIPSTHLCLRNGDFVDVLAVFDAYQFYAGGSREYRADLMMQRIIRLKQCPEKRKEARAAPPQPASQNPSFTDFTMDDSALEATNTTASARSDPTSTGPADNVTNPTASTTEPAQCGGEKTNIATAPAPEDKSKDDAPATGDMLVDEPLPKNDAAKTSPIPLTPRNDRSAATAEPVGNFPSERHSVHGTLSTPSTPNVEFDRLRIGEQGHGVDGGDVVMM